MKSRGTSKWSGRAVGVMLAAALAGAAASARADQLAYYPFTGSSLASTDTDPGSVASDIVLGSGLTNTNHFATGAGNPAPAARIGTDETDGTSFPTAITAEDYVTATLTPAAGQRLVFSTLTFDLAVNNALATTNVELQASVGTSAFVTLTSFTNFSTTAFTTESVDLSARNNNAMIAAGAPVTFRLVVFDNANSAVLYTGFDNVTVNGTTAAIPEPGTTAALAFGTLAAGGAVLRRRRRA